MIYEKIMMLEPCWWESLLPCDFCPFVQFCRKCQRLEHLSRLNEVIVPVEDDLAVLIKKLMKIISNFTSKIKRKILGCLDVAVLGVRPNHVSIFVTPSLTSV